MKTKLLAQTYFLIVSTFVAVSCQQTGQDPHLATPDRAVEQSSILPIMAKDEKGTTDANEVSEKTTSENTKVYVCNSSGATKYHANPECGGLHRCKHEIEETTVARAEAIGLGRCSYKKCQ